MAYLSTGLLLSKVLCYIIVLLCQKKHFAFHSELSSCIQAFPTPLLQNSFLGILLVAFPSALLQVLSLTLLQGVPVPVQALQCALH